MLLSAPDRCLGVLGLTPSNIFSSNFVTWNDGHMFSLRSTLLQVGASQQSNTSTYFSEMNAPRGIRVRSCNVTCQVVDTRKQVLKQSVRKPQRQSLGREDRQRLISFQQHWLPRLLQQQEEAYEVSTRISSFSEILTEEVTKAHTKLSEVMQGVMAPFKADVRGKDTHSRKPGSPLLKISELPGPNTTALVEGFSSLPAGLLPSADGLPDELSGIVAAIQATNQQMRTLEESYTAVDSSLLVLQEGAELRDQQTAAYRDALLQLAEDLELAEEEERQRAAEQARIEAELMRAAAEQRRLEEARREEALQRELQDLVSAASAVQATQASLVIAATSGQALVGAPPIKVEIGVQKRTNPGQWVVLVGGHPSLGNWDVTKALPMSWNDGHVWKASVELPADTSDLQYKAVLCSGDKQTWEKGDNHVADLQGSCDVSLYHVFST